MNLQHIFERVRRHHPHYGENEFVQDVNRLIKELSHAAKPRIEVKVACVNDQRYYDIPAAIIEIDDLYLNTEPSVLSGSTGTYTTTTVDLGADASDTNGVYNGLRFKANEQTKQITAYDGGTHVATIEEWEPPSGQVAFDVYQPYYDRVDEIYDVALDRIQPEQLPTTETRFHSDFFSDFFK